MAYRHHWRLGGPIMVEFIWAVLSTRRLFLVFEAKVRMQVVARRKQDDVDAKQSRARITIDAGDNILSESCDAARVVRGVEFSSKQCFPSALILST
jgi:hypothetical protein